MAYLKQILAMLLLRLILHPFIVFSLGAFSGILYSAMNPDFSVHLLSKIVSVIGADNFIN